MLRLAWTYKDATLPKAMLYNTGDGTILSGSTNGRLDTTSYGGGVGGLIPETLIGNVSEVLDIAQLAVVNFIGGRNGGDSANADSDRFLNISMGATRRFCSCNSDIVGAVMIDGTNTLADTVGLASHIISPGLNPFVATGSMRPNSALSADSTDRGAMIAMNDHLVSAFYATETNGNTVSTFLSPDQGYIAQLMSGQPYFFFGASLPKARYYFNPFNPTSHLPKVVVLYGHQGFDASLLYSAAINGARGIVIMGVGPGALSTTATQAANDLYSRGVITAASFRPYFGATVSGPQTRNIISSGFLRDEIARIRLQLALGAGYDFQGIQKLFEGDVRRALYNEAAPSYNGTVW
ncbi:L-asparaginase [Colletotrichum sojae]|uniref:asparaginase n=1 Tax=Colletotrichum sojae TaxID=2175907 RepID=A0A8H6MRW5_9PEZI|nr:L-asparaginase [Colletotrichum sojae]